MPVSTIRKKGLSFSSILLYLLGIIGVGLVVFFGAEVAKNIGNLGGKSALTVDVLNGKAEVYVNGTKVGETPYNSKDIKPGENKITLKSGNRQYETSINFLPNNNKYMPAVGIFRDLGVSDFFSSGQEFWFEKESAGDALRIISDPSEASVFVDNTEIGKTPFTSNSLSEGDYDMRVEYPGYEAQTARIRIKKGYTLNISLKLFPVPVPSKVSAFEGSPNIFDLSSSDSHIVSDTQSWVNAVIYWNKTRGINLEGLGLNKAGVFDYFLDYKGNIFDGNGVFAAQEEDLKKIKDAKRGGYLGRISDGTGLTKEAKDALLKLSTLGVGGKEAQIKETGLGWLRVRDNPSLNGKEISRVNTGQTFPVLEEKPDWVKIKVSDTISGWISAQYVTLLPQ